MPFFPIALIASFPESYVEIGNIDEFSGIPRLSLARFKAKVKLGSGT